MPEPKLEPQYADFSDMKGQELPNENPAPQDNMPIGYDENVDINAEPKPESQVETKEEDLSHLVNQDGTIKAEATDEQMQKLGVDNPKSYRYFQSEKDKERTAREKMQSDYQRQYQETIQGLQREIALMREQSTPKPPQPQVPQLKDNYDDPTEEVRDLRNVVKYLATEGNKPILNELQSLKQERQQERERIQQEQLQAQQRTGVITAFVETGVVNPQEANEIIGRLVDLQANNPKEYAKFIASASKNYFFGGKTIPKGTTQKGQVPPLGVVPSETETPKKDDSELFFNDMQQTIKRYY